MSSSRTAQSSSRGIDGLCRSNLIMAFDTAKQSSRNLSGLMSIHFLSRIGIEKGDNVTAGFSCGLATGLQEVVRLYAHNLAAGFPATPRWWEDQR